MRRLYMKQERTRANTMKLLTADRETRRCAQCAYGACSLGTGGSPKMCTGNRSSQFRLAGDGELDAERSRRRAVIGASAVTEIDDAHEPQRAQRVIVEMPAAPDIPYPEGNMIQHVPPPSER
jgi:hypothetical protein